MRKGIFGLPAECAAAAACLFLLQPTQQASAQVVRGAMDGLNLVFSIPVGCAKNAGVTLTAGNAYLNNSIQFHWASSTYCNKAILGAGMVGALAANTAYYCYVDGTLPAATPLICSSTVGPNADGQPSAAIGGSTNSAFVGSVVSDASGNIMNFYRNGEEVQLLGYNTLSNPDTLDPAAMATLAAEQFSFTIASPAGTTNSFQPTVLPVLSATSVIIEGIVQNSDSATSHWVYFLDPNSHAIVIAGGFVTMSAVAEAVANQAVTVGANLFPGANEYRVRLPFDANGKIWYGMDVKPTNGSVLVSAVYRGYVEPLGHRF